MTLLFFEFIGTTELLVIMIAALVLFGPRKLPDLGRSLGKSLGEFKRASEDFKRTWESEVDLERLDRESRIEQAALSGADSDPMLNPSEGSVARDTDQSYGGDSYLDESYYNSGSVSQADYADGSSNTTDAVTAADSSKDVSDDETLIARDSEETLISSASAPPKDRT